MPTREGIVAQIRELAAQNGGKPLGRARFESETGVRESDWLGRFWTSWGEAIREAGFEPNEMQGKVLSDEELLAHWAALARRLGHPPTAPELRLHRRANSDFPSWNTFSNRLGSKNQIIARLLGSDDEELREVLGTGSLEAPLGADDDPLNYPRIEGYVYLMRSGRYHKIGRANHVGRRHYEVGLQLPEGLTVVHVIATDDPVGIERYWHARFGDRRANGEWFKLDRADVAAFRRRKYM